jgi:hypothetical protein
VWSLFIVQNIRKEGCTFMKKTLMIILALAMVLTMVMGSVTTVSAKGKPGTIHVDSVDLFFSNDLGTSIDGNTYNLAMGNALSLTAEISPSNATNQKVSWTSSNRKVLSLSIDGLYASVTASQIGTATVKVKTADGRLTASCNINVVEGIPIAMGPISGTPQVGQLLTVGELTPSTAKVAYQWYRSFPGSGGIGWNAISGASSSNYTVSASDVGCYLKAYAVGQFEYTGNVEAITTVRVPGAGQYFIEDFSYCWNASLPWGWTAGGSNPEAALIDFRNLAGNTSPELELTWFFPAGTSGNVSATTPAFSITGPTTTDLGFSYYLSWDSTYTGERDFTIYVEYSADGGTSWASVWSISPTGGMGPSVAQGAGWYVETGQHSYQLRWRVEGINSCTDFFVDNIVLVPGD